VLPGFQGHVFGNIGSITFLCESFLDSMFPVPVLCNICQNIFLYLILFFALLQIRLESKGGKNSSVMFCTNGVLLRVLIGRGTNTSKTRNPKKSLDDAIMGISHIIVVMLYYT